MTSSPLHGVAKAKTTCPCLTPVSRGDPLPGVYQASIPSGKFINLIQVSIRWTEQCTFTNNTKWLSRLEDMV